MPAMTPRERVLAAIAHRQPDVTPWHLGYTVPARKKLEAHLGTTDLAGATGDHLAAYSLRRMARWEETAPGFWRDEWGVVWNRTVDPDIGVVEGAVLEERDLSRLRVPDPHDPLRYAGIPAFIEANPDRFRSANHGFSLFERAWSLRGMDRLLVDMCEAPEFVDALLDRILDFNLGVVDELARRDLDAVLFGDDWAFQQGIIMGPRLWRRFFRPRVQRMFDAVRRSGKVVAIHCCGKAQDLFPDLIEMGLQLFNPFQPEVMDPYEMKERFGDRLAFFGGMSIQRVLPRGTPREVKDEARRLIDRVGRGGGFIISPSHEMPGDIPVENMMAFIEAVKSQ
jgi:uroporphyrinogen decarboxylase